MRADVYFSLDVEADGPIPGPYSMVSLGLAVAGRSDGVFTAADPTAETFYRELRPISDDFVPEALAVSGLDRAALLRDGADPAAAMGELSDWVTRTAGDGRPVIVAYPAVFDWMFLHWYFVRFAGRSPFGFSGALDMKTMYQQKAGVVLDRAGRRDLPAALVPDAPHTHNALDDAVEQGEIFARLFAWSGG
jgi:3'-5' exoribonuclease-like protein